jgi:C-terminal processing protease CtpA/Prc
MMVGELESSHSEVGPAAGGNPSSVTPSLGFTFDYSYVGPGIRVDKVPVGAPGSFAQTQIRPGEYVMAIDGKDVTLDENLYRTINDKQGRVMEFQVNATPTKTGARTVKYTSLTGGEFSALLYGNRVERARAYVEQKSDGKLSYVHIAGMGGGNQVTFERELYEYSIGKKGVIIDVRNNGGGNISDTLVGWLATKQHGYFVPRDGLPEPAPGRSWNKPIVILMAESSFSNAEMFPYAMRERGLARLVGEPTPGYVIWTGGFPLVDGTSARMPFGGVYRMDGSPMEDLGEQPDVRVVLTADDWLADRDTQLDKAIDLLMK